MSRVSYNSLNKRWLSGHDTRRNAESLNALKWLLICLLTFLAVYLVIITAIGHKDNKQETNTDSNISSNGGTSDSSSSSAKSHSESEFKNLKEFREWAPTYFRVSTGVGLAVVLVTIFGVVRESPLLAMLTSTFMLVGVAQSVPPKSELSRLILLVFSPMSLMSVIGLLLAVYTALIWSSEFETPPEIIEEYRWYLSPIRGPDVWTGNNSNTQNGSNSNSGGVNGNVNSNVNVNVNSNSNTNSNTNSNSNGNGSKSANNSNNQASKFANFGPDESSLASTSGHRMSAAHSQPADPRADLSFYEGVSSSADQCSRQSLISTSTSTAYYSSCE